MKFVKTRALILAGVLVLIVVAILFTFDSRSAQKSTDVVSLVRSVEQGQVTQINIDRDGRGATVVYSDAGREAERVSLPSNTSVSEVLSQAEIPFSDWPPMPVSSDSPASRFWSLARVFLPLLLIVGLVIFMLRRSSMGIGKSGGRRGAFEPVRPGDRSVTLADVAGVEEVKEEIGDVIEFLRDAERFHQLGARIPRGVLLVGPPGTGKTLLARAVAGEARASFFSVSGSEFVELYVGVGASRVRELFRKARECAPAIVFIDEIDAIGRKRGRAEHSTEYDQTLNQILIEMDGFDQRSTVVVMAATNRVDILDSALLRPGRFDRKVHVDLPDRAARAAILRVHARGKPVAASVDLDELAARTTGLSGADLANLMNEAAILTARRGGSIIEMAEMLEALDRTLLGPAKRSKRFSEREREVVAYHEAGHALVAHLLAHADPVRKITIVSRGKAGGFVMYSPEEDRGLWTKPQLMDRLAASLGGFAAEEIVFGEVTTGSSNDLEQATSITLSMVARYGMGASFGLFSIGDGEGGSNGFSQRTVYAVESEARELVAQSRALARSILTEHRDDLERLAARLLDVETIEGDELIEMLGPAVTAAPTARRAPITALPAPARSVRPPQRARRPSRLERTLAAPAAVVAAAIPRRRRRVSE
jgi:cell division protease FtsH